MEQTQPTNARRWLILGGLLGATLLQGLSANTPAMTTPERIEEDVYKPWAMEPLSDDVRIVFPGSER